MLAEVARLVGSRQYQIQAQARVSREAPSRWRAQVDLSGEVSGSRQLTATSCDSAARAAALIIALAIDPQAASALSEKIREHEARQHEAPGARPGNAADGSRLSPESAVGDEPRRPRSIKGVVFFGVLGEQALVPAAAMGGLIGGGIQSGWLRADLALTLVPYASATVTAGEPYGADFAVAGIGARGCACPEYSSFETGLCLGFRASRIWARGVSVPESWSRHADVLAMAGGPYVRWPGSSAWAAEVGLETIIPLGHPEFVIQNLGPVYRVPAIGLSGAVAAGYRF